MYCCHDSVFSRKVRHGAYSVTSIETLYSYDWGVSFENSSNTILIHFKIKQVLVCWLIFLKFGNNDLHEVGKCPESDDIWWSVVQVLFICDYKIIKCFHPLHLTHKLGSIPMNLSHWIFLEGKMNEIRNNTQTM